MIFHLKYIFVCIFLIPQATDGGSVTWFEPTSIITTSDQNGVLPLRTVSVNEGSSVTLNWNYSLTESLVLGIITFNSSVIVRIKADGSPEAVDPRFQERFSISSTLGRASLFISNVTVADDKANGEFRCELVDRNAAKWRREIQVQVIVPININGIRGNLTVPEGDNLQLTSNASGRPEPNITWTKEKPGNQGETVVVKEGKVLTITNINRTDAGDYTCTAYNGFGKPENKTVSVNVTYPAKIVNSQTDYLVGLRQSVTLDCGAEGNPPPTYSWTPCNDSEQVCDKNALDISQVCQDVSYTCKVDNGLGNDTKTYNVFFEGKWIFINININITDKRCADGKYNESLLSNGFNEVFQNVFSHYKSMEVRDNRCSTVKLALKFNSITNQTDVITNLRDAAKKGNLGGFPVCPTCINGAGSCNVTLPTTSSTPTGSPNHLKKGIIIAIAVVASLFLVIIVGNLCCWYFSTTICIVVVFGFIRKCLCKKNPDSKEVHSNGGQDAGMEAGYCSPDTQYAAAGPKANYRASNPSSEPSVTYEVANMGSEGRRGNRAGGPREQLPEYAVVDKTKKKKKGPKPGELQYAELDQLTGRGQKATMPRVSGTDTVYADIKS